MALVQDDFRSNIFRCATESPRLAARVDVLGEAKVDHLDVALLVQKQVLRLEISVDDSSVVEVLKCAHHTGNVKTSCGVVEPASIPQDCPELSAKRDFHQHINVF